MRLLVQRVKQASVQIDCGVYVSIPHGLLIFVGFSKTDVSFLSGEFKPMDKLIQKILRLRLWADDTQNLNRCVVDVGGSILLVSQFTLYADCKKGTRPSFSQAMSVDLAANVYDIFVHRFQINSPIDVQSGRFQAYMQVHLVNDGPFTLCLETKDAHS